MPAMLKTMLPLHPFALQMLQFGRAAMYNERLLLKSARMTQREVRCRALKLAGWMPSGAGWQHLSLSTRCLLCCSCPSALHAG